MASRVVIRARFDAYVASLAEWISLSSWTARMKAMKHGGWHSTIPGPEPVVYPLQARRDPWEYDVELYKRRNEIERLFDRIRRFRRVFTRYDKTDLMFSASITLAFIADLL